VVWGAAHGGLLVLERAGFGGVLSRMHPLFRHAYLMLAVMATWVLFRADTLGAAAHYFVAMIGFGASSPAVPPLHRFLGIDVLLALAAGIVASGPYGEQLLTHFGSALRAGRIQLGQLAGLVMLFGLVTLSLAGGAYNPFIYFRF
jgi:alginate O-acetyltransferase complex protein AlgI